MNEKIGFGLRLNDGIDLIKFPEKFREQLINNVKQNKKKWNGYINQNNSRVRLKKDGFAFADAIAVDLMF
jgi:coproporphyrinogen III oxidase-like Fe-S oxidoreductase